MVQKLIGRVLHLSDRDLFYFALFYVGPKLTIPPMFVNHTSEAGTFQQNVSAGDWWMHHGAIYSFADKTSKVCVCNFQMGGMWQAQFTTSCFFSSLLFEDTVSSCARSLENAGVYFL